MAEMCVPLPSYLDFSVRFSVVWTCATVLLLKKLYHESPERRWVDFLLDCLKQLLGAGWIFLLGKNEETCGAYFAGTLAETTVGLLITYVVLTIFTRLFERGSENPRAFRSGEYEDAKGALVPGFFLMQVTLWLTCLTAMKCLVPFCLAPYNLVSAILLRFFSWSGHLELAAASLWAPCFLYPVQCWITDDFIKKRGAPGIVWRTIANAVPHSIAGCLADTFVAYKPRVPTIVLPSGRYEPPVGYSPSRAGAFSPARVAAQAHRDMGVGSMGVGPMSSVGAVSMGVGSMPVHPAGTGTYAPEPTLPPLHTVGGGQSSRGPDGSPGGGLSLSPGGASQTSAASVKDIIETAAQAAAASAERIFLGQVKGIKAVLSQRERDLKYLEGTLKKISMDDELLQHQLSGQIKGVVEEAGWSPSRSAGSHGHY